MSIFTTKTWADRVTSDPTQRIITYADTTTETVTVAKSEGTVSVVGDKWNAANMNDMEDRIETAIDDTAGLIAVEYDSTETYELGSYVIYDGDLYVCTTAITVAEAWNSSKWTATTVVEKLGSGDSGGTVLWTNSSPTSSFSAQTITLSETIANYDYYEIEFFQTSSLNDIMFTTGKLISTKRTALFANTSATASIYRALTNAPSGTSLQFNSATSSDANAIPYHVIGYTSK